MGRGDKKTAKGKRFKGSFGKSRPATATKKKVAVIKKES
jgi:30S ribosomal protein S31